MHSPVTAAVLYVAPDHKHILNVSFRFEREMVGMLETRARTCGRCTDILGDANIHVDLGPLKQALDGLYLGIGLDAGYWVETNDTKTLLARLDLEHVLSCRERVGRF
jgi:hypothetical protein